MAKKFHAVIVGINAYRNNPLFGCINDALAIRRYFKDLCGEPQNQLEWIEHCLLAPFDDDLEKISEAGIQDPLYPTRDNILAAFDHFKNAEDGDFCLFYYSGHGSTVPEPSLFKGYSPAGALQSIVAVDSRINGNPDIVDKELGYLIAKTLEGKAPSDGKKGVHFLAIIDSCHSGTITRTIDDNAPVARMLTPGIAPENLTGFTTEGNCFYTKFKEGQTVVSPEGGITHARYINLSASRNSESAYEKFINGTKHGVFSWCLLEVLKQNGTLLSYAELMRRIDLSVRVRVDNQIPVLGKTDFADDNLLFLRDETKAPDETYQAAYSMEANAWILNAGEIQGIPQIGLNEQIYVRAGSRPIRVTKVEPAQSVLDNTGFTADDRQKTTVDVTLDPMYLKRIKIGLSDALEDKQAQAVRTAFQSVNPRYSVLTENAHEAQYIVKAMPDREFNTCYILTRPGSNVPLFMRTVDPNQLVTDIGKVTRFDYVLSLNNPRTTIPKDAVKITIKTLEGVFFDRNSPDNLNSEQNYQTVERQSEAIPFPNEVRVSGKPINGKIQQPAIKVRIESPNDRYFVGALFCDAEFGISSSYLPVTEIGIKKGDFLDLKFGQQFTGIPLKINHKWKKIGITEIIDYLLVFVSTQPFNLSQYEQGPVDLDPMRSGGFDDDEIQKEDWCVIKIPIYISIPKAKQALNNGENDFGAFKMLAPNEFTGICEVVNRASIVQGKGIDEWDRVLPPPDLWSGITGSPDIFSRGIAGPPDTHLSMIEITTATPEKITPENPITIVPVDPIADDEAIIPFGYDPNTKLCYPLGYTDAAGNVKILRLPDETEGKIGQYEEGQKSVGGSLKLFFQKLVWQRVTKRNLTERLSLVSLDTSGGLLRVNYFNGQGEKDTEALTVIQPALAKEKVLLIIHGIFGDTDNAAMGILRRPTINNNYTSILTFDYENLNTPIEKTAETLLKMLQDCGVRDKSLTIVSHSLGGLVSRFMVEQLDGGARLVDKLIQLGTPNEGSEVADFRKKITGWIALGINGIAVLKPYLSFCSMLFKGLESKIFYTLNQMQPDSPFLTELNRTADRHQVEYRMIIGNTSLLQPSASPIAGVWKQLATSLGQRGKSLFAYLAIFDGAPNDLAVRVDSAQGIPGGFVIQKEMATDHLSYFKDEAVLRELENMI